MSQTLVTAVQRRDNNGEVKLVETVGDATLILPLYLEEIIRVPEFSEEDWLDLSHFLGRPLPPEAKESISQAAARFFATVAASSDLPTVRKYRSRFAKRVVEVNAAADHLYDICVPHLPPPEPGEHPAQATFKVMPIDDAVRFYFQQSDAGELIFNLVTVLQRLQIACQGALETASGNHPVYSADGSVQEGQRNGGGADGHTQLNVLFEELMLAARVAGDSLKLMSNNYRSKPEEEAEEETPLFKFILRVLDLLKARVDSAIAASSLNDGDRTAALALFDKYLTKSPGAYQSQLVKIRTAIEGGRAGNR